MEVLFTIRGRVGRGKQLGRTLGFPTANIETDLAQDAARAGVYGGLVTLEGTRYAAIVNIGRHPTFPEGPATVEAHILDFAGDLYGEELTVDIRVFLRGEMRFADGQALIAQLQKDREQARALLLAERTNHGQS